MTCIDKILLAFVVVQVAFVLAKSYELEDEEGLHPSSDDVSGVPEECDVKYEKVGCFNDTRKARALSVLIFSDRTNSNIDWKAWETYLKRLACRCAKESRAKGYDYFGLQYYGECWSDPQAADKFNRYGKSERCIGFGYNLCDDKDSSECVGGANKNYVYRVVEEGSGSGSGSGFGPTA